MSFSSSSALSPATPASPAPAAAAVAAASSSATAAVSFALEDEFSDASRLTLPEIFSVLADNDENWRPRYAALEDFQWIVENGVGGRADQTRIWIASWEQRRASVKLVVPMINQINDLRSEIVRQACQVISAIVVALGHGASTSFASKAAVRLLEHLLLQSSSANKTMRGYAWGAAHDLLKHCPHPALLHALLNITQEEANQKNKRMRLTCMDAIGVVLRNWDLGGRKYRRYLDPIEQSIMSGLAARTPDTRDSAATSFWLFVKQRPSEKDRLQLALDKRGANLVQRKMDEQIAEDNAAVRLQAVMRGILARRRVAHALAAGMAVKVGDRVEIDAETEGIPHSPLQELTRLAKANSQNELSADVNAKAAGTTTELESKELHRPEAEQGPVGSLAFDLSRDQSILGICRYIGSLAGYSGGRTWVGIELDRELGGSSTVNGISYFKCPAGKAVYVRRHCVRPATISGAGSSSHDLFSAEMKEQCAAAATAALGPPTHKEGSGSRLRTPSSGKSKTSGLNQSIRSRIGTDCARSQTSRTRRRPRSSSELSNDVHDEVNQANVSMGSQHERAAMNGSPQSVKEHTRSRSRPNGKFGGSMKDSLGGSPLSIGSHASPSKSGSPSKLPRPRRSLGMRSAGKKNRAPRSSTSSPGGSPGIASGRPSNAQTPNASKLRSNRPMTNRGRRTRSDGPIVSSTSRPQTARVRKRQSKIQAVASSGNGAEDGATSMTKKATAASVAAHHQAPVGDFVPEIHVVGKSTHDVSQTNFSNDVVGPADGNIESKTAAGSLETEDSASGPGSTAPASGDSENVNETGSVRKSMIPALGQKARVAAAASVASDASEPDPPGYQVPSLSSTAIRKARKAGSRLPVSTRSVVSPGSAEQLESDGTAQVMTRDRSETSAAILEAFAEAAAAHARELDLQSVQESPSGAQMKCHDESPEAMAGQGSGEFVLAAESGDPDNGSAQIKPSSHEQSPQDSVSPGHSNENNLSSSMEDSASPEKISPDTSADRRESVAAAALIAAAATAASKNLMDSPDIVDGVLIEIPRRNSFHELPGRFRPMTSHSGPNSNRSSPFSNGRLDFSDAYDQEEEDEQPDFEDDQSSASDDPEMAYARAAAIFQEESNGRKKTKGESRSSRNPYSGSDSEDADGDVFSDGSDQDSRMNASGNDGDVNDANRDSEENMWSKYSPLVGPAEPAEIPPLNSVMGRNRRASSASPGGGDETDVELKSELIREHMFFVSEAAVYLHKLNTLLNTAEENPHYMPDMKNVLKAHQKKSKRLYRLIEQTVEHDRRTGGSWVNSSSKPSE